MKKNQNLRAIQVQRFLRYSIRKFTVGVASVAIASGLAVLGGANVQAAEEVNTHATETKAPDAGENIKIDVAEKVNTSKLSEAIARLEAALEKAASTEKTASAIESAKAELANAKAVAANEAATKEEVAKATSAVNGKAFVVESMPKATADKKEEKENKNQDPRNGKAIPGKGESGFRDTGTVADGTENPVVVNTNDITQKASELEAEIAKVESLISAENAKREGKKDKEFIEILTQVKESAQAVKNKGSNIPTTEKEKHALLQELKAKVDLLKLYQAKKLDWGAPANNHLANYGNNPTNAIISNLNDTFGTPDFSVSDSHEKVVENQRNGLSGTILGSAKYHWKEKNISVSDAIAGALDGWKIVDKPGKNIVTLVKPEQPTDIQRQNGATEREYNPNSAKVYDNKGKANMDGQGAPNSSGKLLNTMIITPKIEAPEAGSGTVNKDFYLELRKQGTTIYKDFDVNPNSHLYAHLLYAGAYGKLALASTGEKVKLKIVDAYTGAPLSELKREDKKAPDTEFLLAPGSGNRGVSALRRVIQIPDGTTKVRVFIEAADQPTGSNLGGEVEDGYIVAGLGLTTGPALSLTTTVVSGRDKEAYGFTDDSIYKNEQEGTLEVTLSNRGGLDVSRDTKYKVTVTVPQGVKLGSIQGKDLNEANGFAVFAPSYTTGFRYDKQTRELSFEINIPNRKIEPKTGKTDTVKIPFIVTPDYVGEATFKITGQNGFGGKDTLGNAIYPYGFAPDANRYNLPENFRANSLNTSDNPDYKYNRSIYIDSMTGNSTITVPVGTTFEKAKEAAKVSAEELINSEAYREKLATLKSTAALNLSETSLIAMVQGYSTAAVKENSGTLKVPVIHTVGSKKFNNQIDINVNVVASTKQQKVVFEGDTIQNDDIKEKITPATIPGYTATVNNVQNLPTTTGKAGQVINVETTVSYTKGNVVLPETVTVPVLVLPKATGNVEVHKGASVDKVKEVAKAKATEVATSADFKAKLPEGSKDVVVGEITEGVLARITAEKGTNKGTVKVPVTYTVDGTTYTKEAEITVNVLGSEPKTVYTVEGTKPDAEKVKNAVTPGAGGTVNAPKETDLPATTVKAGTPNVTVPTTVRYPTGDETVNVPVEVLPKATPEKVTTLKDTTSDNLTTAVKEKAQAALGKLTLPTGVTVELDPNQTYAVPATDSNGDKDNVPVKVQYKDATGTVVAEDTINVPVTVVSSTPSKIVVFEGDEVTADTVKGAVTPGTDGTKGTPVIPTDLTKQSGEKEVTVPVAYDGITEPEQVKVPVTVLPKPEADEILVAKNSDKDKAKEKVLDKAKKAIEDGTFKGKLPQGATVTVDETVPVTVPDLTEDTEVEVTVKYTVPGQDEPLTTTVKVPVTVVEGVPQIVPVKETNDVLPDPEKSVDKEDYPEGSTFRYKTPEGQTSPIDVTTTGDKNVVVEVLDPQGNTIVEVPSTVRVVESYPKYVPVDPAKKQPDPKENINPNDFPTGTTFEYKDNTPVDTTTPGEKPVTVVAKLNGQPIAEIPATIVVVEPKTQYVPVNAENDKKPKPQDSITPDDYPEGSTFEYKTPEGQTTPYDGTTPGEKDVTVVVKDPDGDTIVEVPAKIKVVQGKEQLTPVNAEDKDKPKAEDSITPSDYPEGSTFEYKVPEGQTTPYDGTTPGDKPVTVVVKDKNGNVLVEVPTTIKVVESKPTPIETPVTTTPLKEEDYTKGLNIPDGSTAKVGDLPDLTTPGEKTPVKVTITLPNGKSYTVDVPVTVTPVKEIETPVTTTPLTPDDYTKGITIPEGGKVTKVENIPDLTTPGKKTPVKVTIELPNGKVVTVDVPVNVTPVKEIETPVTTTPLTPEDYTKGITIPEGGKVTKVENIPDLTTPGKKDPVKVTVELPNGKVVTVDVPVNVTPVKEIETPVTTTPLTPEDYTKGITIPEGGKVTKVENIPDLTTPGKKDPVKVTVELPNGKVVTVEVPVNVTPVKEIETPVTNTPLTPEDYTKGIKIPEGGKVTNVENIPDLTTPGKKDPVKVTVELPNGKVITVEVPVNVTPVKEIETPVTKDKLTPEDILKQIKVPEGATTKVENIPDLTTPGKKDPVKVTITLPNGKVVTVEVPVNVTPITPIETPVTKDKLTPEDILKQIKVPEGATTKVENIPDLTTPGKKDPVKVTITLPNGKVVIVEIPVSVIPIEGIVKKGGDPITNEDVEKHIPKGAKIISIGDKPTTDVPGERPSIPVVIELPNGIRVTMNIPVIVTPKVTPIVVEVGTPITKEDVKKKVGLPEGWEIVEIGEIPTTETPGTKPVVKVKVKLPDGRIITVEVPVTVTPKSQNGGGFIAQNGGSTVQIVTEYLDENGNRITSDKEGKHNPIELEGYEFSHSTTDAKGNTLHHYKKVTPKTPQAVEEVPAAKPEQPSTPEVKSTPVAKQELPNTGTAELEVFTPAVLAILTGLGLAAPTVAKKKDEE